KPQPNAEEKARIIAWNDTVVARLDCTKKKDPGRVTVRRLNRVEYKNTIRDLVGVEFQAAEDFPADNVGYGFDNIGDALSLPPLLWEKCLAAAEKITERAFKSPELRKRIMIAQASDTDAARKIIQHFARRAFRRALRDGEVERYLRLAELAKKNGDSFETGIQLALQAILVSPHFLFPIEFDLRPDDLGIRPLNDFE